MHERTSVFAFGFEPSTVDSCLPFLCGCGLWSHTVVDPVPFSKTHVAWSQIDLGTNHIVLFNQFLFSSCMILTRKWQGASGIIFPIIKAEGVRQMFFPATVPAYYRAPPVKGETKCS